MHVPSNDGEQSPNGYLHSAFGQPESNVVVVLLDFSQVHDSSDRILPHCAVKGAALVTPVA
jgi:hypothetical protein